MVESHAPPIGWPLPRFTLARLSMRGTPVDPDSRTVSRDADRDRQRIAAARSDRSAFRELYLDNVDAVYRYILRRTRDPTVAEDLTADTFERALRAIERYEWRGIPVRYWLLRIADRVTADWFRSRGRRPTAQLPDDDLLPPRESAEREVLRRDELTSVRHAIEALSPAQRFVVVLRLGDGLSHRAIAGRLGRGEGAVRMLYQRALQRIRREVERSHG